MSASYRKKAASAFGLAFTAHKESHHNRRSAQAISRLSSPARLSPALRQSSARRSKLPRWPTGKETCDTRRSEIRRSTRTRRASFLRSDTRRSVWICCGIGISPYTTKSPAGKPTAVRSLNLSQISRRSIPTAIRATPSYARAAGRTSHGVPLRTCHFGIRARVQPRAQTTRRLDRDTRMRPLLSHVKGNS